MVASHYNGVHYCTYTCESEIEEIKQIIDQDLSEPYSMFTFRYFIYNWPELCMLAKIDGQVVGMVVCKLDQHKRGTYRGYVAMLAVKKEHRHRKIGTILSRLCLDKMQQLGADECILETEIDNSASLGLYRSLGFIKVKRLQRYYLNGADAFRLKRRFCDEQDLNLIMTREDKINAQRAKAEEERREFEAQKALAEQECGPVAQAVARLPPSIRKQIDNPKTVTSIQTRPMQEV